MIFLKINYKIFYGSLYLFYYLLTLNENLKRRKKLYTVTLTIRNILIRFKYIKKEVNLWNFINNLKLSVRKQD
ncbi:hypothetical protein D7379_04480, partial [Listeria monocytogenes]|nr:hypothetical protein [Listeria monocytogenes]